MIKSENIAVIVMLRILLSSLIFLFFFNIYARISIIINFSDLIKHYSFPHICLNLSRFWSKRFFMLLIKVWNITSLIYVLSHRSPIIGLETFFHHLLFLRGLLTLFIILQRYLILIVTNLNALHLTLVNVTAFKHSIAILYRRWNC